MPEPPWRHGGTAGGKAGGIAAKRWRQRGGELAAKWRQSLAAKSGMAAKRHGGK
eukprot:gene14006-biopygen12542